MEPINRYLDHAVLKPEMTRDEARAAIQLGVDYDVRSVCVRPADIELAHSICDGSNTDVGVVLGFPHGCGHSVAKTHEAEIYVALGVAEIDMVANYGLIRSGLWDDVEADIRAVSAVTQAAGVVLKVILETSELDEEQIRQATLAAIRAEADYVKTSTGFASGGASEEAVQVMMATADGKIKVKASGGIRNLEQAEMFVSMGCDRLGVGSSTTPVLCGAVDEKEAGGNTY